MSYPRPRRERVRARNKQPAIDAATEEAFRADWSHACENCGEKPVVNATGLCGPCTFGEAATAGGNW